MIAKVTGSTTGSPATWPAAAAGESGGAMRSSSGLRPSAGLRPAKHRTRANGEDLQGPARRGDLASMFSDRALADYDAPIRQSPQADEPGTRAEADGAVVRWVPPPG